MSLSERVLADAIRERIHRALRHPDGSQDRIPHEDAVVAAIVEAVVADRLALIEQIKALDRVRYESNHWGGMVDVVRLDAVLALPGVDVERDPIRAAYAQGWVDRGRMVFQWLSVAPTSEQPDA